MLIEGIIISSIAAILYLESRLFGQHQLDRPIIICPLIGLFLGDFKAGLFVGGSLELVWNGMVAIGTSTPPDVVTGSALAVAYVIKADVSYELALTLAIPISIIGQLINIVVTTGLVGLQHIADSAAANNNPKGIENTIWMGGIVQFLRKFLVILPGYMLGSEAISAIVEHIPPIISQGLSVASGLLAAVGLALLMQITMDKKFSVFLFIGFALFTFFNLSSIGVSIVGAIIAIIYYQFSNAGADKEDGF